MGNTRTVALSIAGLDPSAGAGLMADIKTFEAHRIYGLGITTAITFQNDNHFEKVEWQPFGNIAVQLQLLMKRFTISTIKIGLIEDLSILRTLVKYLNQKLPAIKIIWDPIIKSGSGYLFHRQPDPVLIGEICQSIYLITPNIPEALLLGNSTDAKENAKQLSCFCNVYLKGGHHATQKGKDFLYMKDGRCFSINPKNKKAIDKHGSGCVFSASVTSNITTGMTLLRSCLRAKYYTETFLSSSTNLIGYHKI